MSLSFIQQRLVKSIIQPTCEKAAVDIAEEISDFNFPITFQRPFRSISLLHLLASMDSKIIFRALLRVLLEKGAKLDAPDHEGVTPLHYAIRRRNNVFLEVSFQVFCTINPLPFNINVRGTGGRTALHEIAMIGNEEMLDLFLAREANASLLDDAGNRADQYAAKPFPQIAAKLKMHVIPSCFVQTAIEMVERQPKMLLLLSESVRQEVLHTIQRRKILQEENAKIVQILRERRLAVLTGTSSPRA